PHFASLSLHDALPILTWNRWLARLRPESGLSSLLRHFGRAPPARQASMAAPLSDLSLTIQALRWHFNEVILPLWCGAGFNTQMGDRKSTRLNSSHVKI